MKLLIYLLVDFENLQPPSEDIVRVRGEEFRLWIFHGPHQNKFTAEMVVAWQPLGKQVRFVQSSKTGKNALDFHIAFCLGQAYQQDAAAKRAAIYIVVSKDGGFDALFDYIRSLGCTVERASSIPKALAVAKKHQPALANPTNDAQAVSTAPPIQDTTKKPQVTAKPEKKKTTEKPATRVVDPSQALEIFSNPPGSLDKVLTYLRAHPKNLPSKLKALENHLPCMIGGKVSKETIKALMADLARDGIVKATDQKVEYKIPSAKKHAKNS